MLRRIILAPAFVALVLSCSFAADAAAAEPQIQKRAFLVGVAKYQKDGLPDLNYSEKDMRVLAEELKKQGFSITMLLGPEATRKQVGDSLEKFVEDLGELAKTDVALVGFSGHGQQCQVDNSGRLEEDAFFCAFDTLKDDPRTMISIGQLMDNIQKRSGSSQNLLLVDACRNNPAKGAKGIDGGTARNLGNKISVLYSSTDGMRSFESAKVQHGLFTYILLQGLRGEAATRDGNVTWLNLASYVMDSVPARAADLLDDPQAEQRPNLIGNLVRQPVLAKLETTLPDTKSTEAPDPPFDLASPSEEPSGSTGDLTNSLGMTLKLIPAGEFIMGSKRSDSLAVSNEFPEHPVKISRPFYLAAHEVTRGQFAEFIKATGYRTDAEKGVGARGYNAGKGGFERGARYSWKRTGFDQADNHPVLNVTWNDANEFCRWLSVKENAKYRLPSEAEWEYACRAGTGTRYITGDNPESVVSVANVADAKLLSQLDWTGKTFRANDGFVFTAPVGSFRANKFGLFDMHGNAWEWCSDRYSEGYYARSREVDPLGVKSSQYLVLRGGAFYSDPQSARSTYRGWASPDSNDFDFPGFRVARTK